MPKKKANHEAYSDHEAERIMAALPKEVQDEVEGNDLVRVVLEIRRIKDNHRMVVILAHGLIDLFINSLIEFHCKHAKRITDNFNQFPHSTKLILLNELGILSDHHYRLLDWFRDIRNKAAHRIRFQIDKNALGTFVNKDHRNPDKFADLCISIVSDVLNSHQIAVWAGLTPKLYSITENNTEVRVKFPAIPEVIPLSTDPKTIDKLVKDLTENERE